MMQDATPNSANPTIDASRAPSRSAAWPPSTMQAAESGLFLAVDFAFFTANLFKIREGGWIPLTFGTLVFIVMISWHYGFQALRQRHTVLTETPEEFFRYLNESEVPRVPGTAVFLTRFANTIPFLVIEHVAQMRALYETVIALTVKFEDIPRVASRERSPDRSYPHRAGPRRRRRTSDAHVWLWHFVRVSRLGG
jgi:K+ transporter